MNPGRSALSAILSQHFYLKADKLFYHTMANQVLLLLFAHLLSLTLAIPPTANNLTALPFRPTYANPCTDANQLYIEYQQHFGAPELRDFARTQIFTLLSGVLKLSKGEDTGNGKVQTNGLTMAVEWDLKRAQKWFPEQWDTPDLVACLDEMWYKMAYKRWSFEYYVHEKGLKVAAGWLRKTGEGSQGNGDGAGSGNVAAL